MKKLSFCTVQTNFQKDFKKAICFYTEQTIFFNKLLKNYQDFSENER